MISFAGLDRALIVSVRANYAQMIFDKNKSVELRRVRPRIGSGDTVLVYVPAPVQALVGAFVVERIVEGHPDVIWPMIEAKGGVTKTQFDAYYRGALLAHAIFIRDVCLLEQPVTLSCLRNLWVGFRPPQGYRYLETEDLTRLAGLSHTARVSAL
jgi:predicted transcriptional regulator